MNNYAELQFHKNYLNFFFVKITKNALSVDSKHEYIQIDTNREIQK